MQQTVSEKRFEYTDPNGRRAACHLRVWEESGRASIAIVTELNDDNPGMSITNASEVVWREVWVYMERPEALVMIEHYARTNALDYLEESFDLVTFAGRGRFADPQWCRVQPEDLRELLGGAAV
jgi:hypothetical protein